MAVEFICDACGKRAPGGMTSRDVFKPHDWFSRSPKNAQEQGQPIQLHACSRECVERLNTERGERTPILPI